MSRRAYIVIGILSAVVLVLSACGRDEVTDQATAIETGPTVRPTEVRATTVEAELSRSNLSEPARAPEVTPASSLSTPTAVAVETPQSQPLATSVAVGTPEPQPSATAVEVETPEPQPTAPITAQVPTPAIPSPTSVAGLNGKTPSTELVSVTLAGEALTTVEVVKLLTPSVVQIVTAAGAMGLFNQPVPSQSVGTGVILDKQGHILTNNHVIAGAETITVTLANGESFPAEVVGADPTADTAVIRIDAPDLHPAQLGNSSDLEVGEDVIAIGHALGLEGGPTVSKGVVSALGRSIEVDPQNTIVDLIQTDAAINPGNSGGALVNAEAEVIGINTAIIPGSQGIGFAINIDDVKVIVGQLIEMGFVQRGFLGISPFNLNPGLANQLRVPVLNGVAVAAVTPGTAAAEAGLREGDVIIQLGDEPIRNTGELSTFLLMHLPGETVDLAFYRQGTKIDTEITLGSRDGQ